MSLGVTRSVANETPSIVLSGTSSHIDATKILPSKESLRLPLAEENVVAAPSLGTNELIIVSVNSSSSSTFNGNSSSKSAMPAAPTLTTPTLTPTTLKNIEQMFAAEAEESHQVNTAPILLAAAQEEIRPPDPHAFAAGFEPPVIIVPQATAVVEIKHDNEATVELPESNILPRQTSSKEDASAKKPTRLRKLPPGLTPEEERKKLMRRQRNKEAAARCRKRRLDQTVSLQEEVEAWEMRNSEVHDEIRVLEEQKRELETVLAKHKAECKKAS